MFIKVGQWPIKSVKLRFGEKKGLCEAGPGSQWVHAAGPVRESQEPIPAPQRPGLEWASQGLLLTQQTLWGESCACTRGRGVGAGGQAGVGRVSSHQHSSPQPLALSPSSVVYNIPGTPDAKRAGFRFPGTPKPVSELLSH